MKKKVERAVFLCLASHVSFPVFHRIGTNDQLCWRDSHVTIVDKGDYTLYLTNATMTYDIHI